MVLIGVAWRTCQVLLNHTQTDTCNNKGLQNQHLISLYLFPNDEEAKEEDDNEKKSTALQRSKLQSPDSTNTDEILFLSLSVPSLVVYSLDVVLR